MLVTVIDMHASRLMSWTNRRMRQFPLSSAASSWWHLTNEMLPGLFLCENQGLWLCTVGQIELRSSSGLNVGSA